MTEDQKAQMYAYMAAMNNDDLPDGAWQACLEDAAKEWGNMNGVEVDTHDAFIGYIEESQ